MYMCTSCIIMRKFQYSTLDTSGVMSQNIWGGHNLCEGAKRPSPRERSDRAGGGCGRGVSTVESFFIFRLENVQAGACLRRKFRLDDMYLTACHDSTDRGKGIFLRMRKHIYENMHPKIIFAKFQTHANVIPSTTLLIILIWRRYPDVETREQNERAWRGCDAVGCHSNAVSFYYLWYGAVYI